jgi:peptidoglycan endopeptidase LytF
MNQKTSILLILLLFTATFSKAVDDSTGLILKNGKVFKLHTVDKGQGLYAIGRRYNTDIKLITEANPEVKNGLKVGAVILVPTFKTEAQFFGNQTPVYSKSKAEYTKPTKPVDVENNKPKPNSEPVAEAKTTFSDFYTVKKGETLYSIATKFNTTVDFLKQLNRLESDHVDVGVDILVPIQEGTSYETMNPKNTDSTVKKDAVVVDSILKPDIKKYSITTENVPEYNILKVKERGTGRVSNDKKLNESEDLIFHHNAPENSFIRITNPANNKTVYAKVIRNFEKGATDTLIVYISKKTANYLEVSKKEIFDIELSYTK